MTHDRLREFDSAVRLAVYDYVIEHARPPSLGVLAELVTSAESDLDASLRRLANAHMLVLSPGTCSVWMAMPFSTVPTRFVVEAGKRSYFANCAWDALGVPVILGEDATIRTACADCGQPAELRVRHGRLDSAEGLVHFAVPVRQWWNDVGYT